MPRVLALNKWDRIPAQAREELAGAFPGAIPVSARTGEGLPALTRWLMREVALRRALPVPGALAPEDGGDGPGAVAGFPPPLLQ